MEGRRDVRYALTGAQTQASPTVWVGPISRRLRTAATLRPGRIRSTHPDRSSSETSRAFAASQRRIDAPGIL